MISLDQRVLFAFLLTLVAGLCTGLGSLLGLVSSRFSPKFLSLSLSFSAGVMIFVSFVEIFPKARQALTLGLGATAGYAVTVLVFFAGMVVMALIDNALPSHGLVLPVVNLPRDQSQILLRTGLFSALAIAIHNFPEGLATFVGALSSPKLGISIAIAIAIHNIPEGLAISAPVYYATGSRRTAFWVSFASGLAEPIGAVVGYIFLRAFLSDTVMGLVFASVAGLMVYICFDELLPAAQRTGAHHHVMIAGLTAGMLVMSISLVLLG